jgi:hypothetical protein
MLTDGLIKQIKHIVCFDPITKKDCYSFDQIGVKLMNLSAVMSAGKNKDAPW